MVAYSFKRRFVGPVRVGLGWMPTTDNAEAWHAKRQTIRADRKRHARPGEELQLYCGMRTKQCFLIGRARCISVQTIKLWFGVEVNVSIDWGGLTRRQARQFVRDDGFKDEADMMEFWRKEHGDIHTFEGVIIKWAPL